MIEELLARNENKTLEFKSNCLSLDKILQTIIAFSNTSGGIIVVGVEDQSRIVLGLDNVLLQEERISNAITDSITPLIFPVIEIHNYRNKEILLIHVNFGSGPYYLKSLGPQKGIYVRVGSSNRIADLETVQSLERVAKRISFDEYPCIECNIDDVDWDYVDELFRKQRNKVINESKKQELGLISGRLSDECPSNAAVILFGKNKDQIFPDAVIRCARFKGIDKVVFIDHKDFRGHLIDSISQAEAFVARHTKLDSKIEKFQREDTPEYPPSIVREAIMNAVLHADYSMMGCTITIAVFDDRIEIMNPGSLPFGMTIEQAKRGASRLRNRVIGRVLKELEFIEHWGSGIKRMIETCENEQIQTPFFEEIAGLFRVTLYSRFNEKMAVSVWETQLVDYLKQYRTIKSGKAAEVWGISARSSRDRLQKLVIEGKLIKLAVSKSDPQACYALPC